MEKEYLIKKWLDNNLSPSELEAFKALDDYESLVKLSKYTKRFKAPIVNYEEALNAVEQKINFNKTDSNLWYKPLLKIAAVLAICFGTYYLTTTHNSNYSTGFAEKANIELPDASTVNLNAISKISFNKSSWKKQREVFLEGEAFFKVAKGSTFNVLTNSGIVTVLGTQFNVKQRNDYFEVSCYEGLVKVKHNNVSQKITPGQSFILFNNKIQINNSITTNQPEWLSNISAFKSVPLTEVLSEFERNYNVKIVSKNIDLQQLFTGKFPHNNFIVALKSIVEPLNLTYSKKNKIIFLKRE